MTLLAQSLLTSLGRPVLDRTGLTGIYNFTMSIDDTAGFTDPLPALKSLGLKVTASEAPIRVAIIDAAVRPTAN